MNVFILALCFSLAVAESSDLMDDLEKILSSDSMSSPPDVGILDKLDELDEMSQDAKEPENAAEKGSAKFGYCLDGSTPADGPNMRGCGRKLCYDDKPGSCNKKLGRLNKMERKKVCYSDFYHYRERCPFSCGFCKPASPGLECRRKYGEGARFGCCWDGMPALTPNKRDCMACRDLTPHTCRQFYNDMFGVKCGTNSFRIRTFLHQRCANLCGRC